MRQEHAKGKLVKTNLRITHPATAVSDQGLHIYAVKHKPSQTAVLSKAQRNTSAKEIRASPKGLCADESSPAESVCEPLSLARKACVHYLRMQAATSSAAVHAAARI